MVVTIHALGIVGTILCAFASILLAVRFGFIFKGDSPGIDVPLGKCWKTLGITTMEKGQKVAYSLLAVGFILLLIAQILSCLI